MVTREPVLSIGQARASAVRLAKIVESGASRAEAEAFLLGEVHGRFGAEGVVAVTLAAAGMLADIAAASDWSDLLGTMQLVAEVDDDEPDDDPSAVL